MSSPLSFRTATPDDALMLAELAARAFTETFGYLYNPSNLAIHLQKTCSQEFFAKSMHDGDVIQLALSGEAIAGYSKCGRVGLPISPLPANAAEIHRMYVISPFQTQGVGRLLMEHTLTTPLLQNVPIYLGVWENNLRAQRFYGHYGFKPVGEYTYYVGEHADREIIMARD